MSDRYEIHEGDCLDVMRGMADASVDAVVTDPPYGLAFMGESWDHAVPGPEFWREALRVAKPGAHLVAFGGTRTFHRLACAIEDAGWVIRDSVGCLSWVYGSGFPKSLDVGKAIDAAAGAEREVVRVGTSGATAGMQALGPSGIKGGDFDITAPATEAAKKWNGYGTALKPAHEPVICARKPLIGTVAANVLEHGTGALNVDGCRVGTGQEESPSVARRRGSIPGESVGATGWTTPARPASYGEQRPGELLGRWPPNLILCHHPDCQPGACVEGCHARVMGEQSGNAGAAAKASGPSLRGVNTSVARGKFNGLVGDPAFHADTGTAARFFPQFYYTAKASRSEREHGLGDLKASHPCVKPVAVMEWLIRLVTPLGGIVLDPFAGSGTTGVAAMNEGARAILIEREPEYVEIIEARMNAATRQGVLDLEA